MKQYGLIGYPLTHSFSKHYFDHKFALESIDADYHNFPLQTDDDLEAFITQNKLNAFNVTIPYKEKIIPFLDEIDSEAQKIGSVNCVVRINHKLIGYNTDVIGFEQSLINFCNPLHKKALVFGTGGSSKAVQFVLQKNRIPCLVVSRQDLYGAIMYADLNEEIMKEYHLLINTTPVGMFPLVEEVLPIPFYLISEKHFLFDAVYNPEKTKFLEYGELRGAKIKNGHEMLLLQAEASYKLFTTAQ